MSALRRIEGVARANIYGSSGLGPANLLPVHGEFTKVRGITQIALSCCVLLALFCPAALAFSYDEIVLIVQAEEKVFGKGNYDQSLDQRLVTLENAIFGHTQDGSDAFRLRSICRNLQLEKPSGSVMAAPYAVEISPAPAPAPAAKAKSAQTSEVVAQKPVEAAEKPVAIADKPDEVTEKPLGSTVLSEAVEQSPPAVIAHNETRSKSRPKPKPPSPATAPSIPAIDHEGNAERAAAPSPVFDGTDTTAQQGGSMPEALPANIFVVVSGVLAIITGVALFFFLKSKDEESLHFGRHYDEYEDECEDECEDEIVYEEIAAVEHRSRRAAGAPAVAAVCAAPIFDGANSEASAPYYVPVPDRVVAETEAVPAEGDEKEGSEDETYKPEFDNDDHISLLPGDGELEAAVLSHVRSRHAAGKMHVAELQASDLREEFSSILDTMSKEQLDLLLEDFTPSMVAMDTAQEFHFLNASSEDVIGEYSDELPMEWPAFEPIVAPRISTVDAFLKDTLRTATELIGCAEDPTEREPQMQIEYADCSVPEPVTTAAIEDGECASYRALAQVLIDAANTASCPNSRASSPLIPTAPISGRRIMVAQLTGRNRSADLEDRLRTLFSEKC